MKHFAMHEVDPAQTTRAAAFAQWMQAPMPMVTLLKTLDVGRALKMCRRRGCKFNMLMCWCLGRAASKIEEFYLLPSDGKLLQYERLAVNVVVATDSGGINTCDIPFSDDWRQFNRDYLALTGQVRERSADHNLDGDYMIIGTSSLAQHDIDGAVNMYSGIYNNPFMIWGRYRKRLLRGATLAVSFQFHHAQMDGAHAARFLDAVQQEIDMLH